MRKGGCLNLAISRGVPGDFPDSGASGEEKGMGKG